MRVYNTQREIPKQTYSKLLRRYSEGMVFEKRRTMIRALSKEELITRDSGIGFEEDLILCKEIEEKPKEMSDMGDMKLYERRRKKPFYRSMR